jgi:hypothetical protein
LHPRFRVKIQARLFCQLLLHDRVQIADAAVGKYDQVPVTINITNFCKPSWSAIRAAWWVSLRIFGGEQFVAEENGVGGEIRNPKISLSCS